MEKIIVGESGLVRIPVGCFSAQQLSPGEVLYLEPSEHNLVLHFARCDVERAYIEVTTLCNLNCAMCVRQVWQEPLEHMTAETFQAVLSGLGAFPQLRRVIIGGYGEPLMHPGLVDMVSQIHALGYGVTLITNGVLLKRPLAEALLRAGVDTLVVSLDSMHNQAYRKVGYRDNYNPVIERLKEVAELMRDGGWKYPSLGLEFVVTRNELETLHTLPDLAREIGATFLLVNNLLPHTPELAKEIVYDCGDQPQIRGWGVHRAGWIAWGAPKLPRMRWGAVQRCPFISDPSITIAWDGGVSPCSALMHSYPYYIYGRRKEVSRYVMGSVKEKSLAEIWKSEEYVGFRARVRDFRFPSCVDCGMDCTYAQENTDCWGNEPSCADCLWAQGILHCP